MNMHHGRCTQYIYGVRTIDILCYVPWGGKFIVRFIFSAMAYTVYLFRVFCSPGFRLDRRELLSCDFNFPVVHGTCGSQLCMPKLPSIPIP